MSTSVSLYIRQHGSRKYEKASSKGTFKGNYPAGTTYVLRHVRDGKRGVVRLDLPGIPVNKYCRTVLVDFYQSLITPQPSL